ncbi:putative glycosyltransferase [Actinacidiphila reveromycinica]|uniref:Putative glycosyltransferase n=1 Tax=Actinacidiphila reveromycinica TaxID=659352 RepID=A0A7U3UYU6_9ACTN|nr:glycosyltransferase [Streptomyces sp. SN-593]BBB01321.1 putative glycosyltransferase [Streptomyces sp. SN-593]
MRVVLTCLPYYSHMMPVVVPVATALRRAGHTVAVATAPAMAGALARAGVDHLPLPHVRTLEELLTDPDFASSPGMPAAPARDGGERARARARPGRLTLARAGALAGVFARDVIVAAERWRPDLIVRECNEFGGYLAAERLGLPRAVLDISPFSALNLPYVHDTLGAQRADLGLDPVDDVWHPVRGLLAGIIPRAWYPPSLPVGPTRSYRPDPVAGALDPVLADLPDDRPLVVAGLGTVAPVVVPESRELLTAMVAALGELPCTAVVAAEADFPGPRPDNVRLVPFVPLSHLLGGAELFLSHGGFGSVHLAMAAGTPMVNVPMFGDQPANAERIQELGLGLHVEPTAATPGALAAACARVLADHACRYRAAGMSRRLLAEPGYDVLADDLSALHDRGRGRE